MKANKLFKKLALSGVALGAAAVTLSATTYAWYTANTTATVEAITGMTEAKADGTDVYVSRAETYTENALTGATWGGWGPKVTPICAGSSNVLKPVSYVDGATTPNKHAYVPMASATGSTVTYGAFAQTNVFSYSLRFHVATDEAASLYFKTLTFTPAKITSYSKVVASNFGGNTGIDAKGEYFADLAKALKLTVSYQALNGAAADGGATTGTATYTTYDLTDFAVNADVNINSTTGADALGYYDSVMGTTLRGNAPTGSDYTGTEVALKKTGGTNPVAFAEVTATGYVEVTFTFWLDGWDSYCYDVMRQQKFDFSFTATVKAAEAADLR